MTPIEKIIERLKNEGEKFGITLNPPTSETELAAFREVVGIELPSDIVEFYRPCNGFESEDYMFRIHSLREMIENKMKFSTDNFSFADYLIYSDTWNIRLNNNLGTYGITNDNHETQSPTELCNSLSVFLEKYLDGTGVFGEQGLYKWADEIKV